MFGLFRHNHKEKIALLHETLRQHALIVESVLENNPVDLPLSAYHRIQLQKLIAEGEEGSKAYSTLLELLHMYKARAEVYQRALSEIHSASGAVCPEFEVCDHPACAGSAHAWLVANDALKAGEVIKKEHGTVTRRYTRYSGKGHTMHEYPPVTVTLMWALPPRLGFSENGARAANHQIDFTLQVWRYGLSAHIAKPLGWVSLLTRWIPDNGGRGYKGWFTFGRRW